jgi:hypothetical protein
VLNLFKHGFNRKTSESQLTVLNLLRFGRQPTQNWIDKLSDIDLEK